MGLQISRALSFLRNFWRRRADGQRHAETDLRERLNIVAISLNEKGKIHGAPPRAKAKHFKPKPYEGRLELSTYCMDELSEAKRWHLLDSHSDKKPIAGRSELAKMDVVGAGLQLDPDWDPERHVNIVAWPADERDQHSAAQALYGAQCFVLR